MRSLAAGCAAFFMLASLGAASAQSNWSGFYLGGSAGYASGKTTQDDDLPPPAPGCVDDCPGDGSHPMRGALGGFGAGFNWQNGAAVFGIEGDFSFAHASGSAQDCGIPAHECGGTLRSLGTLRGRFGWSAGTFMPYVTGGYAFGDLYAYDSLNVASGSKYRGGWTLGGGIEAQLAGAWSAKLEYLYVDLGTGHLYDIAPGVPEHVSFSANVVRLGLNFRFGAEPLSRRY